MKVSREFVQDNMLVRNTHSLQQTKDLLERWDRCKELLEEYGGGPCENQNIMKRGRDCVTWRTNHRLHASSWIVPKLFEVDILPRSVVAFHHSRR
jgi:hypothetical protein